MEVVEGMGDRKDPKKPPLERNDEDFSEQLQTSVDKLTEQIYRNVRDIPEALLKMETSLNADKTSEEMCSKFDSLIPPLLQWKKEKNEMIFNLERSYHEIYTKWQSAQVEREKDKAEIESLKNQILMQSTYCANLGAVFGHMVWRASNHPDMVNYWLLEQSNDKVLGEFLKIADTTIAVFFKAYGDVLPPKDRDEYNFAVGLLGTLANVSATAEGRQLIIENTAGKSLVKSLMTYLPRVPTASGLTIKKLILTTLWNMCINVNSLRYLFELQIGRVVVHCLDEPDAAVIQELGLNILQSITYDLEPQLLGELIESVPIEKIRQIAHGGQDKIAALAWEIMDYLADVKNPISNPTDQHFNK